ncbi:MAG: hypothetical protein K8R87_04545 [Verrucomicrobia bacterium]|nr:hypothetical protein [Verrucomicrobiota bacterium]
MLSHFLLFIAGLVCGLGTVLIWQGLRFAADLKATKHATAAELFLDAPGERDRMALVAIDDCKKRLRWSKDPNPEWLTPLIDEVPRLVREIAMIYHPESPKPMLAPGLSHFTRSIQLAASDVTEFLQTRTVGRLVDVSAHTALRTWEKGREIVQHETMQKFGRWYRKILPVWQVLRFKSPLVWASMAVSNVAARTLQPAIIDIISRRAVELYSGRISGGSLARLEDVD